MAFAPNTSSRKPRLLSVSQPDFKDFSGPPGGDYVRYVEKLMRWSEQEQERQRLQALGNKARALNDGQWERTAAQSATTTAVLNPARTQPGSVDSRLERIKHKAQAKAVQLQQQVQQQVSTSAKAGGTQSRKPAAKNSGVSTIFFFAVLVLMAIFKASLIPVAIIGWVVFNVVRAVRAASRGDKS